MKVIVKYEYVKGRYEDKKKQQREYESLRLYVMTVADEAIVWHPNVDQNNNYEQTVSAGGFRERVRRWVKAEDIGEGKSGINVPVFEVLTIRPDQMEDLLGVANIDEFEAVFASEFFLHKLAVTGMPNDYGRLELTSVDVSPEVCVDLIKK